MPATNGGPRYVARVARHATTSPCQQMNELFSEQCASWKMLADNVAALSKIQTRELKYGNYAAVLQFNPARVRSVKAATDKTSISQRPCFLCPKNIPTEQRGVELSHGFVALCNPFPIFSHHFTLSRPEHTPQEALSTLGAQIDLAVELQDGYSVFFNGARAGASAPDHLHFQACPIGALKAMSLLDSLPQDGEPHAVQFFGATYYGVMGADARKVEQATRTLLERRVGTDSHSQELVNIVTEMKSGTLRALVIPRAKHRPDCYAAQGDQQYLISPGSVEMCGVVVTVREEDFRRLTAEHLHTIYLEVTA